VWFIFIFISFVREPFDDHFTMKINDAVPESPNPESKQKRPLLSSHETAILEK
jgi:hypothetical protein